jgi:hypothetical protein
MADTDDREHELLKAVFFGMLVSFGKYVDDSLLIDAVDDAVNEYESLVMNEDDDK